MRTIFYILSIVLISSCGSNSNNQKDSVDVNQVALQEDVLHIGKMDCEMCVASVEKGLKSVEGVEFVKVTLEDSTAVVKYDKALASNKDFREAIEKRGYLLKDR